MNTTNKTVRVAILLIAVGLSVAAVGPALAQTVELTFADQEIDDGQVTVEGVTTDQPATVVITYTDGDEEVVAGIANADNLAGEDVTVQIMDAGGFPGEHTAWVFADSALPSDLDIGDDATPVADSALDSQTAVVSAVGELSFNNQELRDGTVTVEDVATEQTSTVVVTYTDGDEEIIAGITKAGVVNGEDVAVEIEDAGGFPGEHTAWVFDNSALPSNLAVGDDATPVADSALDSQTAEVSDSSDSATGELTFADQDIDDGRVTVEGVTTDQPSTVVITYTDGDEEVVAGTADAGNLAGGDVTVQVMDAGGFPGEHTAWVFADSALPSNLAVGDDATPIAEAALASQTATVSAVGDLTFNDQELSDGTVTVEDVATEQTSTVVITYTDGDEEVVAGVTEVGVVGGDDVTVSVEDAGGFPGEHTAWVFDNSALPSNLAVGDDATPVADSALDSQTAAVSEADEATETAEDTDGDGAGFGIVVGLLALVAAALLSVRRHNSRE